MRRFLELPKLGLTLFALTVAIFLPQPLASDDWQLITPQEMALKDDPDNPGASAIILYREEFTDDERDYDRAYYRIKVLKEEGKKYADIEIPFLKGVLTVGDIKARTVQPDGKILEFKGEIFEKPYLKARRRDFMVKTLTLPGVQVGSIIEYQYMTRRPSTMLFDSRWILQSELSTRRAHFQIVPYSQGAVAWVAFGLPRGKTLEQRGDRTIHLQMETVPALPQEEFMPPEELMKARVLFFYLPEDLGAGDIKGPDQYWKYIGKRYFKHDERFIGKRKEIQKAVSEINSPDDPPETKLRRLYARAQQVRNLSYERSKTEKEEKREKLKENFGVGDVLKNGYGYGSEINQLFAALARAAGFEASIVYLTHRGGGYFEPNVLSTRQFDANVVHVRLGTQVWDLDPATLYCPFDLLPWEETDARGILPHKDGGSQITMPEPKSANAVIERRATLQMDASGSLQGMARIVFMGQEALDRRLDNREHDDRGRRKAIEDEVKEWLPAGSTVELTNSPAWEQSDDKLEAEFKVTIPQYASATGRRLLLPLSVFQAREKYPFRASKRQHPIYFPYPFQQVDEVTVELPPGVQVESLPAPRRTEFAACRYGIARTSQGNALRLTRTLVIEGYMFRADSYPALRVFYDNVRAGDEEQIVLKTVESAQAK